MATMVDNEAEQGEAVERLADFIAASRRLVVLTGAGVSTDSGIPDYRGRDGEWKRPRPMLVREFLDSAQARGRYWGRSMVGWQRVAAGRPSAAHRALAALEADGRIHHVITQNVDGLHQRAGSRRVTDLHGRLDTVECLGCGARSARRKFQQRLEAMNPGWAPGAAAQRPDGDAELRDPDYEAFAVPACHRCGGILKPWVVFFGENVPRPRLEQAMARLAAADALLVVGSSLMVFSGYRFVRHARRTGMPVAIVNVGRTRADEETDLKIDADCGRVLQELTESLA